ncbi:MAG: right-handed parallel beta-helix repeat-containing protein [Phycisphaerae bacterium]|nr:right-handed parallel beta-helix repeat-containing protein [Phycisphaerae bacterium]
MRLNNIVNKAWNKLTSFGSRLVSGGGTALYAISIPLILAGGGRELKAETYHVPTNFKTIQAAIDDPNVVDKDIIIAAPGRYVENINFLGKNITLTSTNPNDPNIIANTILDGNDVGTVVTFNRGEDPNCVLNGFTITGGYSNGVGGGIHCSNSSPTIANCIIKDNETTHSRDYSTRPPGVEGGGGGLYCDSSNPTITNCGFINNSATYMGGGMYNSYSNPKLINCMFNKNFMSYVSGDGGGMNNLEESNPLLIRCVFNGNSASNGGGMWNANNSNPVLSNCTFGANSAQNGGGMWNGLNSPTLTNCRFSGNLAIHSGGGMYNYKAKVIINHSTFGGDRAYFCGGIVNDYSNLTLSDCILWENSDNEGKSESAQIVPWNNSILIVNYSCIQGLTGNLGGIGNIGDDPCFVDPGYWDPNDTPNDTNDDFWVEGDYHLKSQGWRWNTQREVWTLDDVTSPCIDAGDPMTPIMYEPFPNGGIVNMGAYGGTPYASKSYFGTPPCGTIVAGDVNGDCKVDFKDFRLMALHWLDIYSE